MLNKVLALLESVIELERDIRLRGELYPLAEEGMLEHLQIFLHGTPALHSKYLKTIIAISADLGIPPRKPGSGVTPDIMLEKGGINSSGGESSSARG